MSVTALAWPQPNSGPARTPESGRAGVPAVPLTPDHIQQSTQRNAGSTHKQGFGIGVLGTASAEAGALAGAGATTTVGAGVFYDGARSVHPGAYAGAGAFASAGEHAARTPRADAAVGALGAFAGIGVGVFVTNAASAQQLRGTAQTYSCNVGAGPVKLSVQLGASDGTYVGAVTVGPGIGLDVSRYPTQTGTLPQ